MQVDKLFVNTIILLMLFTSKQVNSQCAMCKAVVEANLESGGTIGAGLNDGILYLMAMPYISIIVVGIVLYNLKKDTRN